MKVLMVATENLPVPPVRGGAIQTYMAGVAPILSKRHELTILSIEDPSLPARETTEGITYVRVPGVKNFEQFQQSVVEFLRQHSFDLIHVFNRPRLVPLVRQAAPRARIILSMHNDMFIPEKITHDEGLSAVQQSETIVTISKYVGEKISSFFPEAAEKCIPIYSGVDLARFTPSDSEEAREVRESLRKQFNLDDRRVVLFVGRLSPAKGADVLVRAMYELGRAYKQAALVLVGSRWYSDDRVSDYIAYVRSLAARCPVPVVTTGFVPPDQIHKWFWVGDIFVCPSQWEEPLARVHYEAMAAGLPIVTTARGGNPEVVVNGQNGYVIDQPSNPSAFAEKISALAADPAMCKQMGRQGRALAEQKYSWNRVAQDILSVWEPS